jgi:hypothetical protein
MKRLGIVAMLLAVGAGLAGCQTPRFCNRGAPCAAPAYATCAPAATWAPVAGDCGPAMGGTIITSPGVTVTPGTLTPGPETYAPPGVIQ